MNSYALYFIIFILILLIIIALFYFSSRRQAEGYADTVCNLIGQSIVDLNDIPKQFVGPVTNNFVLHASVYGKTLNIPISKDQLTIDAPVIPEYIFNSKVFSVLNSKSTWDNLFISIGPYLDDPFTISIPEDMEKVGGIDVDITNTELSNIRIGGLNKIVFGLSDQSVCSPIVNNNSIQYKSSFEFLAPLTINLDISTEVNKITTIVLKGPMTINMNCYVKGTYQLEGKLDTTNNQIELDHLFLATEQQPIYDTSIDISKLDINASIAVFIKTITPPLIQKIIQDTLQSLNIIGKLNTAFSKFDKKIPFSFDKNVCAIIDNIVDTINNQIKTSLPNGKPVGDITLTTKFGNKTITIPKDKFTFHDLKNSPDYTFNSNTVSLVNSKSTYDSLYFSTGQGNDNPFMVSGRFIDDLVHTSYKLFDLTLKHFNDIQITISKENCASSSNAFEFKTEHQGDMLISIPDLEFSSTFNTTNVITDCDNQLVGLPYYQCTPMAQGPVDGTMSVKINLQLKVSYTISFTYDIENDAFIISDIKIMMSDEQLNDCIDNCIPKDEKVNINYTNVAIKATLDIPVRVEKTFTDFVQKLLIGEDGKQGMIKENLRQRLPNLITTLNSYLGSFQKIVPLRKFIIQKHDKTPYPLHFTPSPASKKVNLARILHISIIVFVILFIFVLMSITWFAAIPFPKLLQMSSNHLSGFRYHAAILFTCSFLSILCFSLFWAFLKREDKGNYSEVHKSLLVVSLFFGFIGFIMNTIMISQYIRKFSSDGKPFTMFLGLLVVSVLFMAMDIVFINHKFPTS
jgi:preprotein translocase subunit Sss1